MRIMDMGIEEKYQKLFRNLIVVETPKGLETKITARIKNEEKKMTRIRIFVFGGSSVASFVFSLWAIIYLVKNLKESGFWQYFSLIFSENGAILSYWRELSLSLVESLPVVSLIIFLSAVGLFIWSFTKTFSNVQNQNSKLFKIRFSQ